MFITKSSTSVITHRGLQTKIIREDAQHNMYVHACTEVEVKSPEDGLEVSDHFCKDNYYCFNFK